MDLVNLRIHGGADPSATGMPTAEQLGALADLRQEGKLDLIGVSTVPLEGVTLPRSWSAPWARSRTPTSLVHRDDDAIVDYCDAQGIAYVPYFPLGSAFGGGPTALAADPAIAGVAAKHGVAPSQVALAWLLHRSPRILLIPGTSSVAHLEENLAAAEIALDQDDLQTLRDAREIGHPQWPPATSDRSGGPLRAGSARTAPGRRGSGAVHAAPGHRPTVDRVGRPGDEGGLAGGQETDDAGDLLGPAQPRNEVSPQQRAVDRVPIGRGIVEALDHEGVRGPGAVGVAAHRRGELDRGHAGELDHARLARAVRRAR